MTGRDVPVQKGHTLHIDLGIKHNGYCSDLQRTWYVLDDGATVFGPRWERYDGICELPVETGNIFTLELHVVVPDRGLVSLEEDVLVTDHGVEYLSIPQTKLRIIRS